MKVVFFGTPPFAAHLLQGLLDKGVEVAAVVTKPDRPKGRSGTPVPSAVKALALAHNLPLWQPAKISTPEWVEVLSKYEADLFLVVAYGEILSQAILDIPHLACLNVHASLLPKYRGAAPIQRCLMEGETETGITLIHMAKKMDAGDMIAREALPLSIDTTFGELEENLCTLASTMLLKAVDDFALGHPPVRVEQEHDKATFAPKVEFEDGAIDWSRSAGEIHNLVRALNPYPGAWCYVWVRGEKKLLKIHRTALYQGTVEAPPGTVLKGKRDRTTVACGEGALELLLVQLEGKKSAPLVQDLQFHV